MFLEIPPVKVSSSLDYTRGMKLRWILSESRNLGNETVLSNEYYYYYYYYYFYFYFYFYYIPQAWRMLDKLPRVIL